MRCLGILVVVAFCGCSSSSKEQGTEGGPCYGNGTCNAGLVCASNLCVLMPGREAGRPDVGRPDLLNRDEFIPDRRKPDSRSCASLNFTGTARVAVPNSTAFNLGTTISMLAWVKMPSFAAPWALFDNGVSGKYCPPCGMAIDVSGYIGFGVYGSQGPAACEPHFRVTSSRIIPAQKWVHVAAVYDNSEVRFYIDGVGETARTVTPVTPYLPIHDLWLGGEEGPHAAPGGTLSGSQLWSRALTATEVQQAMTTGVANKAGLVGSWPLNEGTGTIAYDASGNGHSGNIVGATWQAGCPP